MCQGVSDDAVVVYTQYGIFFSHSKEKEVLVFATTWMNLENMTLCESQIWKVSHDSVYVKLSE